MRFPSTRSADMKISIKDHVERNFGQDEIVYCAEKYIMEMTKKSKGTSRDPEVEVLVAENNGDEEVMDTIVAYKVWKVIALDDEGSIEDRDAEETDGEGRERVAKEGMVPLGMLRDAEEDLKTTEAQFSRETEQREERQEGSKMDVERKYEKKRKRDDDEGGSGEREDENGKFSKEKEKWQGMANRVCEQVAKLREEKTVTMETTNVTTDKT